MKLLFLFMVLKMTKILVMIFMIFGLCFGDENDRHYCIEDDRNEYNLILSKVTITKSNTLKLEYLRQAYDITNHMLARHTEEQEIADDYFNIQKILGKVYLDILSSSNDDLKYISKELEKAKM